MKYCNDQNNNHSLQMKMLIASAAAVLGIGTVCWAAPPHHSAGEMADGRPPATQPASLQTVEGTVDSFDLGPRGEISSIVVKTSDRLAQLNLPPQAAVIAASVALGQKVSATAEAESLTGDRAIYMLATLTTADGKKFAIPHPGERQNLHVDSTVKQLNYSPRGEVDGFILSSGDFVQVPPGEAATLNLAVGAKISADGMSHPTIDGHHVIEATKVNDTEIKAPPPHEPRGEDEDGDHPNGPPRGGPGRGGHRPGPGGFGGGGFDGAGAQPAGGPPGGGPPPAPEN